MDVKNIWYDLPGYFCTEQAKKIKMALEGTGIAKLFVQYGGVAGNNAVTVGCYIGSDCETVEDVRDWVVFLLAQKVLRD